MMPASGLVLFGEAVVRLDDIDAAYPSSQYKAADGGEAITLLFKSGGLVHLPGSVTDFCVLLGRCEAADTPKA